MTEIYINDTLVDVKEDLHLPITYTIADIKNPDKRNTSYSKTIKLPASKNNNLIFSNIHDITKEALVTGSGTLNFSPDFNPNLKAKCQIYKNGLLQMNGYCQLLRINKEDGNIEYEVAVFGVLGYFFVNVEGYNLTDLDFSEYDHTFNKLNQSNSWDTKIVKNGSDYINFSSGVPIGKGYVYPLIDYGYDQSATKFKVKHLYPAIYLKEYVDKIFEFSGFTYTSNFFSSELFKRLIIPFNGVVAKLSQSQIDARKFYVDTPHTTSQSVTLNLIGAANYATANIPSSGYFRFDNDSTGSAFDPSNVYNTTTGVYTVNKKGTYSLSFSLTATININEPSGTTATIIKKNRLYITIANISTSFPSILATGYADFTVDGQTNTILISVLSTQFNQGDKIVCNVSYDGAITFSNTGTTITDPASVDITIGSGYFLNNPISTPITEGETIQLNSVIPREVKIKDFMMSIIKMFNLYVDIDPNNEKNLLIEPLIDFYSGNSVIDWTDKVDLSKNIEINPVSEIEGKDYKFSYKEDTDFFNSDYKNKYSSIYGERDISIDNDFVKGTKDLGIIFSPTPVQGNFVNDIVIPRFVKQNDDGSVSPTAVNIRILYYGGLLSCGGSWKHVGASVTTTRTTYPYAGHLDNPYTPTIDLLYDVPESIGWTAGGIDSNYTNNNLYNKYYKQFVEEITDKDSKLVRMYFHLRPSDIFNLSFKNFIHVRGVNYRLNQVIDYDPDSNQSTWVELSKIKQGIPFSPSTIDVDNGNTTANVLEGGEDEVRSLSATSPIHIVDGGRDAVINSDDVTNIHIVDGGK